jgi:hypothetical protein
MDDAKLIKLSKRIRVLNVLLVLNALIFIAGFAVTAFVGYMAVQEIRKTNDQLHSLSGGTSSEAASDLQDQLCSSSGTLKTLLDSQGVCN